MKSRDKKIRENLHCFRSALLNSHPRYRTGYLYGCIMIQYKITFWIIGYCFPISGMYPTHCTVSSSQRRLGDYRTVFRIFFSLTFLGFVLLRIRGSRGRRGRLPELHLLWHKAQIEPRGRQLVLHPVTLLVHSENTSNVR